MNAKQLRDFLNSHDNIDRLKIVLCCNDHQYRIADASIQTADVVDGRLYEYDGGDSAGRIIDVILIN